MLRYFVIVMKSLYKRSGWNHRRVGHTSSQWFHAPFLLHKALVNARGLHDNLQYLALKLLFHKLPYRCSPHQACVLIHDFCVIMHCQDYSMDCCAMALVVNRQSLLFQATLIDPMIFHNRHAQQQKRHTHDCRNTLYLNTILKFFFY
ncbi:MAG: hypothetical protein ACD_29C00319G0001 [uncultured bacterium]|nr:MAG: hypothetical protein ACD_29C00319G0001 [uncultured bacterium]